MTVRSIEGTMEKKATVVVHGEAGAFKTTFAMSRLLSRQYGFPFPGFPQAPGNCIYVTGEALDRVPPPDVWAQTFCRDLSPAHYFGQVEACRGTLTSDAQFMELQSFLRSLPDKPDDIVIDHMLWLRGRGGDGLEMAVVRPMIDRLEALSDEFEAMVTAVIQAEEHFGNRLAEACLDAVWHVAHPEPESVHARNTMRRAGGEHQGGRAVSFRRRLVPIAGRTAPVFMLEWPAQSS